MQEQISTSSRRYGVSCLACRRRKQKCDAQTPICGRCHKLKEACIYDGPHRGRSSTERDVLTFLQSLVDPESPYLDTDLRPMIKAFLSGESSGTPFSSTSSNPSIPRKTQDQAESTEGRRDSTPRDGSEDHEDPEGQAEVDELLMHMSIGEDGQNGHYGLTSLFYQTPSQSVVQRLHRRASKASTQRYVDAHGSERLLSDIEDEDGPWWSGKESITPIIDEQGLLKANAAMIGAWESLAFHQLQYDETSDSEMIVHLLKTYFCWQYGSHCVVYRPVFTRDMALSGPYFNQFLLNVICANASRYSDIHVQLQTGNIGPSGTRTPAMECGNEYLVRAKALLQVEMDKPSSVPTIQGLLLLGQRECACGNLSQGWQYTGMAFRAMRDLGIHLDCNRLPIFGFGTLSSEDREIRRRLFWSAYTWDKIISLALGRTPTFNAWQNVSPGPIVDDTEDEDTWAPYCFGQIDTLSYPVHKSYSTLNFRHFIKLCDIIQKIIMQLYNGRPGRLANVNFVTTMRQHLFTWLQELPDCIKLKIDNLPEHCPPPHIFSTNALYRATWILLYRTFLPYELPGQNRVPASISAEAALTCTQMAKELHLLFGLYQKTFQLRNMTYTLCWSMYSAAMINAFDFQSTDPVVSSAASERLSLSLHALERGSLQCPGTRRSVDIIKQRLRAPVLRQAKRTAPPEPESRKRSNQLQEDSSHLNALKDTTYSSASTNSITSHSNDTLSADDTGQWWDPLMTSDFSYNGSDLLQNMLAMPSSATTQWWNETQYGFMNDLPADGAGASTAGV